MKVFTALPLALMPSKGVLRPFERKEELSMVNSPSRSKRVMSALHPGLSPPSRPNILRGVSVRASSILPRGTSPVFTSEV